MADNPAQPPQPPQPVNPGNVTPAQYTSEEYTEMARRARQARDWPSVDYFERRAVETAQHTAPVTSGGLKEEMEDPTSLGNLFGAAVEPNMAMLTGGPAAITAGYLGAGKGLYNLGAEALGEHPKDSAADWVNAIMNAGTYQPRSTGGKNAAKALGWPFEMFREHVTQPAGRSIEEAGAGTPFAPAANVTAALVDATGQTAAQVATGAVLGKGSDFSPRQAIADVVGKVSPKLGTKLARVPENPDVKALREAGMVPSVGQRANVSPSPIGRQAAKFEEYLAKNPVFGAHVTAARARPLGEHIYAQLNDARRLAGDPPVAEQSMTLEDALKDTEEKLDDRYDQLLARTSGDAFIRPLGNQGGSNFVSEWYDVMEKAKGNAAGRRAGDPVPLARPVEVQALDNIVVTMQEMLSPSSRNPNGSWNVGGKIDGMRLRELNTLLKDSKRAAQSGNIYEQQMVPYIKMMQDAFDRMLRRSNPGAKEEWDRLSEAYSQFKLVQRAATTGAALAAGGAFTPRQFLSQVRERALRQGEAGRKLLARGEAQGQKLATSASKVLGNRVPNSGTPEQLEAWILAGDAAATIGEGSDAASGGIAGTATKMVAALVGLPAFYSRTVQKWLLDSAVKGHTGIPGGLLRGLPTSMAAQERDKQNMDERMAQQLREVSDLGVPGEQ